MAVLNRRKGCPVEQTPRPPPLTSAVHSPFATVKAHRTRPSRQTGPAWVASRPRRIQHAGLMLDTGLCVQRYCASRGCFVVQSLKEPLFLLETPTRLNALQLKGA